MPAYPAPPHGERKKPLWGRWFCALNLHCPSAVLRIKAAASFCPKANDDPIPCNLARRQQEDAAMRHKVFRHKTTRNILSKKVQFPTSRNTPRHRHYYADLIARIMPVYILASISFYRRLALLFALF